MTIADVVRLKVAARAEAERLRQRAQVEAGSAPETATRHLLSALARFKGRVIAGYLPIGTEIDPRPAMESLSEVAEICLPVVSAKGAPLSFRRWTPGCALVAHKFGTMIPAAEDPLVPEALIVPLLAFDRLGHRLGYGGGYYDRTISDLRTRGARIRAFGFAYGLQEMAALPVEPFDARLDAVITEGGIALHH
jgi:5-formyltetrahydrofolate cyclo-ligase